MVIIDDPLNINIIICGKNTTIKIRNNKIEENHVKNIIVENGVLINFIGGDTVVYNDDKIKIHIPTLQELLLENGFTLSELMNIDPIERDRIFASLLEGEVLKLKEQELLT